MLIITLFNCSWIIWNIEARNFVFRKWDSFIPFRFKRKSRRIENIADINDAPEADASEATANAESHIVAATTAEASKTEDEAFNKPQSVVTLTVEDERV